MATWVEDITQALTNLGGQAHRKDILEEVRRIRKESLPLHAIESMQGVIETYSSDSDAFRGKDLFKKMGNGFWALRSIENQFPFMEDPNHQSIDEQIVKDSGTWLNDIMQAFLNLGGKGSFSQIFFEMKKLRQAPLPKNWKNIIQDTIYKNSSDTQKFQGNDLFQRVDKGVWAIKDKKHISKPTRFAKKYLEPSLENYQILESFDEIANTFRTIKQYRDYQDPDSPSWKEYVDEIFHVLGFSTNEKKQRLMTLNLMGTNHTPKAIVCYIKPGENFDEITPGLKWESYLFYAAKFHQIDWGIITDGLRLKIIHYKEGENQEPSYWPDLDGVVCKEKLDTFCTIYKVFSYLKGNVEISPQRQPKQQTNQNEKGNKTNPRMVFWKQLIEKGKQKGIINSSKSTNAFNWINIPTGKSGVTYSIVLRQHDAEIQLYIDQGDILKNKKIFDFLNLYKESIEKVIGKPLDWQRLETKRASRIRSVIEGYGFDDFDQWDVLQDQMIDLTSKFIDAFQPVISKYFSQ